MPATLDAPASDSTRTIPSLTTGLSDHERRCLRRAFEHLAASDTAGFHYALWVGFGDGWQAFRAALIKGGFVELRRRDQAAEPTPLAREFLLAIDALAA